MKITPYAISQFLRFRVVVCGVQFSSQIAWADQWWPALGWNCDEEAGHLVVYPIYFDANKPMPATREGFYVPMAEGWEKPREEVPVFSCRLTSLVSVDVTRIGLRVPSARGNCGAAAYSDYSLSVNGEERAEFAIGCHADTFVKLSGGSDKICNFSLSETGCRRLGDETFVKLNALGHFSERPL